jgi:formylglycine-generating enzyme required for sulfatase activity
MEQVGRLSFVPLLGDPPPGLDLDPLPAPASVRCLVENTFSEFFASAADVETVDGASRPIPPAFGLHIIYVYGHAWLTPDGPRTSSVAGDKTVVESGGELVGRLVSAASGERTILILDTCYAAAFENSLVPTLVSPRLVVYASGAAEKAIALNSDRASRFSLALTRELSGKSPSVDLVRVVLNIAEALDKDGIITGQQVTYRMNGSALRLVRGSPRPARMRERTVSRMRNMLFAAGGVGAALLVALVWFYWSHVLLDIDLAGLPAVASDIRVVGTEESIAVNGSLTFEDRSAAGERLRFWAKASDLILRVKVRYWDGAERAIAWHLDLTPGLALKSKSLALRIPPISEIASHPGMAYIPEAKWFHGREREQRQNTKPYWIDIHPPSVDEYRPIIQALLRAGRIQSENSFLLQAETRSAAVDALGLGQLRALNKDVGNILGIVDQASSSNVSAPSDIVVGLNQLPCARCPAPMTRHEAELYCASRDMRLPTDLEWEMAVRGVDGRVYPWGNQLDGNRANVAGLPEKGQASPSLKPVDAYKNELSPFGLFDTVGNAGDWVEDETGAYERVYMGATYRFNPEDATAFRILPVTDSDYLVREITARCVAPAGPK